MLREVLTKEVWLSGERFRSTLVVEGTNSLCHLLWAVEDARPRSLQPLRKSSLSSFVIELLSPKLTSHLRSTKRRNSKPRE